MQPAAPRHGRTLRVALVTLVLLLLLGLIAYSSRTGFGSASQARPTPGYVDWAMSVFLVVFVLMIPFAIYAQVMRLREVGAERNRRSFQSRVIRGLAGVFLLMLIGLVVSYLRRHGLHLHFGPLRPPGVNGSTTNGHKPLTTTPYEPTFRWPVLWATLVLFAVGGAVWLRRRGRAAPAAADGAELTVADDVAATIGEALDDLEAEPDARRAVIAAYARMERVLARHGLRRLPSETPVEYLRRILLGLTSRADAVTRLTGLFEQAKFSRHEIDGAMKQEAIDALRAIRDDLQSAPA